MSESDTPLTDRLKNMLAQVGHPDYSLAEFCTGLRVLAHGIEIAERRLRALERPGWVTAPEEPIEEMLLAARDWSYEKYGKPIGDDAAIGCYKAMLAAREER